MSRTLKLANPDQIRTWAAATAARPARTEVLGEKGGVPRFRFGNSNEENLENMSWQEFFETFEENDLALLIHDANRRQYEIVAR